MGQASTKNAAATTTTKPALKYSRAVSFQAPSFYDGKYLSAAQKKAIFQAFVRLVLGGFQQKHFTKALYSHMHLHLGFIAHFNQSNFFMVRLHDPEGRAVTLATTSTRGGSKWRFCDENSSATADLNYAMAEFVDSVLESEIDRARRDEISRLDAQMAEIAERRNALTAVPNAQLMDDGMTIDATARII